MGWVFAVTVQFAVAVLCSTLLADGVQVGVWRCVSVVTHASEDLSDGYNRLCVLRYHSSPYGIHPISIVLDAAAIASVPAAPAVVVSLKCDQSGHSAHARFDI